jgi:hypothetical protein
MHDVCYGMSRSQSLADLPSHHMALSDGGTEYTVHKLKLGNQQPLEFLISSPHPRSARAQAAAGFGALPVR